MGLLENLAAPSAALLPQNRCNEDSQGHGACTSMPIYALASQRYAAARAECHRPYAPSLQLQTHCNLAVATPFAALPVWMPIPVSLGSLAMRVSPVLEPLLGWGPSASRRFVLD